MEYNVVFEYAKEKLTYDPRNFNQFYNYDENQYVQKYCDSIN